MTNGNPTDAVDAMIQANIVAALREVRPQRRFTSTPFVSYTGFRS